MKDYFDSAMTYKNLRLALNRCCRGVRWKDSVAGYELHAPQNTHKLLKEIQDGTYKISPYQHFTIHEPKQREITATRIRDRQVQMALCQGGLYQDIVEHFIYDNCACQKGKGTNFALDRMKTHLLRYYRQHGCDGWVLKCDIRKFFPSTRHDVAKSAMEKRIGDPKALKMVFEVIDSFDGEVGIGLGSQISQLVELAVLDDLDHRIKEKHKIKAYVRNVDDFVMIHENKEYLKMVLNDIQKELEKIGLELNEKTRIFPLRQGIKFLQWRFVLTETGAIRMYMSCKKLGRERRRLKKLVEKERSGVFPEGTSQNSLTAWKGSAEHGNTYFQVKRMEHFYKCLKEANNNGDCTGIRAENGA